jgi:hypothetical protein
MTPTLILSAIDIFFPCAEVVVIEFTKIFDPNLYRKFDKNDFFYEILFPTTVLTGVLIIILGNYSHVRNGSYF